MKAVQQTGFGDIDVLQYCTIDKPTCKAGQIMVKVKAAGVNPVDTYVRQGAMNYNKRAVPFVPGKDYAGEVVETSEETASEFPVGTRVFVCTNTTFGGYAEYAVTSPSDDFIGKLADNVSYEEGACLGVPYMTAMCAIFKKGEVKPGQNVFIHGASGGVGIAACNIASAMGCTVYASAGTEIGAKNAKDAGATYVYNHYEEGYYEKIIEDAKDGIDFILENSAHTSLTDSLNIVKADGVVVIVGSRGFHNTDVVQILKKQINVKGVFLFTNKHEELCSYVKKIEEMSKEGKLKPVCVTYKLEDAGKAQTEVIYPSKGGASGRIVLQM